MTLEEMLQTLLQPQPNATGGGPSEIVRSRLADPTAMPAGATGGVMHGGFGSMVPGAPPAPPARPESNLGDPGRIIPDAPNPGTPYQPTTPGVPAGAPGLNLPETSSVGAFLRGLGKGGGALLPAIGEGVGAVEGQGRNRLAQNQTYQWLISKGSSPEEAQTAIGNPELLQKLFTRHTTSAAESPKVQEIYDDQGRKQKVQWSSSTGKWEPLGGAQHVPDGLADNLTPGEKRVDQAFAKSYEDFILSGSAADFDKNLAQLRDVLSELENPKGSNLSGPLLGRLPDSLTAITNPEAVDARQRVEEVVQRNLRIVLGAQFTQKEGENLIARAFNPALDEATNAKRLKRLIGSMEKMKAAKMLATDYFEQHGTMKGFKGATQFSVNDIIADIETPDASEGNAAAAPPTTQAPGASPSVRTYNPETGRLE